ncbi:MAG: hypothetical protein ACE5JG_09815 [Planctomycetota bacterium]
MLEAIRTPLLLAALAVATGCHGGDNHGLFPAEGDFLAEDVIDLMTVVFQTSENAFLGDVVAPGDVVEAAGPANGFTVTYDLPLDLRIGLGEGFGRATLQVSEDGVPHPDPLSFTFATTTAQTVDVLYTLRYDGVARSGRFTDVALDVSLVAVWTGTGFEVDHLVTGRCDLEATFCRGLVMLYRAAGGPRDGIVGGFGDGDGVIDDPDVFDVFDMDLDWFAATFRAEGPVGCCARYEDLFTYAEVQ